MNIKDKIPDTESKGLFESAFDYAAIGMGLIALDGFWLKANNAICEIVGYSRDELLKLRFQI